MFEKIVKNSVPETIIEEIQQKITAGELLPGEKLPSERALAQMFSVSRSSVREAMKALQYMGFVEIRVGEGCFLKEPSLLAPADQYRYSCMERKFSIRESMEAREILESQTVRLAAIRGTEKDREQIQQVFEEGLLYRDDPEAFLDWDFRLHLTIAEATHNRALVQMLQTIREALFGYSHDALTWPGQVEMTIECHRRIVEAIVDGEPDLAEEKMLYHLKNTRETANAVLESRMQEEKNGPLGKSLHERGCSA
jgi:GntR family transcriptional repressor for pyruvate dehydrogenase complex